ncbi:MAG: tRNA lysidine(34) synthetase TilS [Candidatus Promineifilaceae bacterium]|nr:tRNA lysidine(34) synthetase TilS [Candidatus Promineifilaceae bacterium]
MSESLVDTAKKVLSSAGVTADSNVVIGVSGGPDSLALLHILKDIVLPGHLYVGHVNHQLRDEADEEAAFVASTADSWNIPCRIAEVDVGSIVKQQGLSVEEAARFARYEFLDQLATEVQARIIVVAHHADDQVESIFFNLVRGSGLKGLGGMKIARPLVEGSDKILVRPFLDISRLAIERYCQDHDLAPRSDSSNWDLTYRRNYIRHEILPRIQKINPQFNHHLLQLANVMQADDDYLRQLTVQRHDEILVDRGQNWIRFSRSKWRVLPLSLQRRTLRYCVQQLHSSPRDLSFRSINQAQDIANNGLTGAKSSLLGDLVLRVAYDEIVIERGARPGRIDLPQLRADEAIQLPVPGQISLGNDWTLNSEVSIQTLTQIRQNRDPWTAYVDIAETEFLTVRNRVAGERIQPLGMNARTASIQDLMVNYKLPAHLRPRWPIVEVDAHPVWIVGYHVDERAKVTERSKRVIKLTCRKAGESKHPSSQTQP